MQTREPPHQTAALVCLGAWSTTNTNDWSRTAAPGPAWLTCPKKQLFVAVPSDVACSVEGSIEGDMGSLYEQATLIATDLQQVLYATPLVQHL